MTAHHFEHIIDGREYHVEVTRVSNRWRAQLQRTQGVPTALMPFYGETPDEAAQLLVKWLTLAHRRHVGPSASHHPADLTCTRRA